MRIVSIILLVLVVIPSSAAAQGEADTAYSQSIEVHLWGAFALAYSLQISDLSAVRLTVDPYVRFGDQDRSTRDSGNYISGPRSADENSSDLGRTLRIGITAEYVLTIWGSSSLEALVSLGPSYSYQWESGNFRRKQTGTLYGETDYASKTIGRSHSLGAQAGIGFRYSLTHHFGLLAEYRMSAARVWTRYEWSNVAFNAPSDFSSISKGESWQISLFTLRVGFVLRF